MELPRYTIRDLWIPDEEPRTEEVGKDQENGQVIYPVNEQEYCLYLGNRKYIDLDNNGEPMEVMGMQSALPFTSFKEADQFIREHWIDARVTEYYDKLGIKGDD